jgi:molecular chaperone DnaJ
MKEREYGSDFSSGSYGGFGGYSSRQKSGYQDEESIRRQAAANYIQTGHYKEAMNVLGSLSQKNGEWYYLSAMANMGMGNNVNALNDIREAVRLEPDNAQYKMMQQRMEGGGTWYQQQQNPFGGMPMDSSDMCCNLCLANLFCNLCFPGAGMFCC